MANTFLSGSVIELYFSGASGSAALINHDDTLNGKIKDGKVYVTLNRNISLHDLVSQYQLLISNGIVNCIYRLKLTH